MTNLGRAAGQALGTSQGRPVHGLNELYCRTRAAQAEAERRGFAGMAAKLAREPGVDPAMVRALARHGGRDPGRAAALGGPASASGDGKGAPGRPRP